MIGLTLKRHHPFPTRPTTLGSRGTQRRQGPDALLVKLARDLTRPISPKWWFSQGNPLISGKSRLVKYYSIWPDTWMIQINADHTLPETNSSHLKTGRAPKGWPLSSKPRVSGAFAVCFRKGQWCITWGVIFQDCNP